MYLEKDASAAFLFLLLGLGGWKMFGDYGIYCDGKIFGLICDDHFYLKPTDAVREMLRTIDMRPPYPGAKPYFYIADVDDHDYLSSLVKETCKHLPEPKPKKKK